MMIEKISVNDIKMRNRENIYYYIRMNGPVSKMDIVTALRLSLPTVTQNLKYLKGRGLIDDSGRIRNTGGRNATAYMCLKDV